jgi:antitoxin ParD1/3/4
MVKIKGLGRVLNISLSEQIQTFVEEQASVAGFGSINDYIHHLILREQERVAQQERIESLLLEGLESGEPIEATDDWWQEKRDRLAERFQ